MGSSSSSKYDVFLSFRGVDTRRTFVSHLYRSLDQNGIRTYKDENQQTGDGRISPEVTQAIRESKIAVVVISENYASSIWCLDVLIKILAWVSKIKTVFYEVDPGDLTRPNGKFADDLRRLEERQNLQTVNSWRDALRRLESRTNRRFCSRNWEDDSKMLNDLIISISSKNPGNPGAPRLSDDNLTIYRKQKMLAHRNSAVTSKGLNRDIFTKQTPKSLSGSGETGLERDAHEDTSVTDNMLNESASPVSDDSNGLIGMYRHKKAVYRLLDLESKNQVRTVGIWGENGVGKTTLAECVFEDISSHFQQHCFLTNVNNIYQNRISPSLLQHLTRTRSSNVDIFDAIKPSLVNQNVLLVVVGADTQSKQFKDSMKVTPPWLGPGSRVIVTSKDKDSLDSCGVKYVYEMECLRYDEALQVFSQFAFNQDYPFVGFERLSVRAVLFARHLPLALKVLGSSLYGKDEESWKITLRRLEASLDNGTCWVSSYIGSCEYLPRHRIDSERYVRADEGEYSLSYYMLL